MNRFVLGSRREHIHRIMGNDENARSSSALTDRKRRTELYTQIIAPNPSLCLQNWKVANEHTNKEQGMLR